MARSKSVPRSRPLARKCSFTRAEKNRSRDSSKQIPVRSSISMRISLNSCSLRPCAGPWRSLITVPLLLRPLARAENHCLPQSAGWDGPLGIFQTIAGLRIGSELRKCFVQLIGQFHELADRRDGSTRALRRLPRDAGNDLHRVRHAFRATHLLFGSQRYFLNEFRRLAHHV